MTEWLFWITLAGIIYPYVGYPLLLSLIALVVNRSIATANITPSVTMIMAVHNEEKRIGEKLENLLSLEYPTDRLEIVVVSDCSSDTTDAIVANYAARGIILISLPMRRGKHFAQRRGIESASGEIMAFTDAAPTLDHSALLNMMRYYADPAIGCVSSEDRVREGSEASGEERSYIGYLMTLRRLETQIGSVVGLSGSFFSARRELCEQWWNDRSSDFFVALEAVRCGYRAVNNPQSLHYYGVTQSTGGEFSRKRRTVLNGLVVFFNSLDLLNPFRFGLFSFQLASHKLCRWIVPFLLIALLALNIMVFSDSRIYMTTLACQALFYGLAFAGILAPRLSYFSPLRTAAFFVLSNAAMLLAWIDLARGQTRATWDPTKRQ